MPEAIRCPSCSATLRVPENLLGRTVKCPKCQTTFTAATEAPEEPAEPEERLTEEPVRRSRRPAPPPPEEEEERGYEEEDEDRPRRRRRRSSEAKSAVMGPAIALMVVGGLAVVLSLLSLVLNLAGAGFAAAGPKGGAGNADAFAQGVGGVFGAIFGLLWGGVIAAGAFQMNNLRSYGFAMTACIIAMLPCNICCLLGLPFGIWGLVMLNKPEVKNAFS